MDKNNIIKKNTFWIFKAGLKSICIILQKLKKLKRRQDTFLENNIKAIKPQINN